MIMKGRSLSTLLRASLGRRALGSGASQVKVGHSVQRWNTPGLALSRSLCSICIPAQEFLGASLPDKVTIVEVGPRDGLQNEKQTVHQLTPFHPARNHRPTKTHKHSFCWLSWRWLGRHVSWAIQRLLLSNA